MDTNIKFEAETQKVTTVLSRIGDMSAMEINSKYPELWEAMLDAETQIDEVPDNG